MEKNDRTKQAATFTGDQLVVYWRDAPDDQKHLPVKSASILAVFGLERKCECHDTKASNVELLSNGTFMINGLERSKQSGPKWEMDLDSQLLINWHAKS